MLREQRDAFPNSRESGAEATFSIELLRERSSCSQNSSHGRSFLPDAKTIGFGASCALLVNNITGPGVPQLPNMFAEAGWLLPCLCILLIWFITSLSAAMYCEAMRCIPGNEHFISRIEYTTIVNHYFGRRWYIFAQIGLQGALQSLNIISIIQSSQVMDSMISAIFGKTCALNLTPFPNKLTSGEVIAGSTSWLSCVNQSDLTGGNAWGCHVVLSLGFLATALMAVPCSRWNLDDNMTIQSIAFVLTATCWALWIVLSCISLDMTHGLPAINSDPQTGSQAAVLGTVLFNFGFVTTVPSWVNEKHPRVSVNRSLWVSTILCIVVFFAVGISGGLAFQDVLQGPVSGTCSRQVLHQDFNCPNTLLQALTDQGSMPPTIQNSSYLRWIIHASVYLFPIVSVVSSIPVFSIVVKYNMLENGFSAASAFAAGILFPWSVALPLLYMPNVLAQIVNFTSLIFVSFTDFIVPVALFVVLHQRPDSLELQNVVPRAGTYAHFAFPPKLRCGNKRKSHCAIAMGTLLAIASCTGVILTVMQGSFALDSQTCVLVGS